MLILTDSFDDALHCVCCRWFTGWHAAVSCCRAWTESETAAAAARWPRAARAAPAAVTMDSQIGLDYIVENRDYTAKLALGEPWARWHICPFLDSQLQVMAKYARSRAASAALGAERGAKQTAPDATRPLRVHREETFKTKDAWSNK